MKSFPLFSQAIALNPVQASSTLQCSKWFVKGENIHKASVSFVTKHLARHVEASLLLSGISARNGKNRCFKEILEGHEGRF